MGREGGQRCRGGTGRQELVVREGHRVWRHQGLARRPGSTLRYLELWANRQFSSCLGFLICKMGIPMFPPSEICLQRGFNEVAYVRHSAWLITANKTEP